MSEFPAPPFFTRRCGGSLNYAPPLMMAECLTLCSLLPSIHLTPSPSLLTAKRPPPPPRRLPNIVGDGRSASERTESRAGRITSVQRALSDLDSCDAFALLARLVKVTGVLPKCMRVSCFPHRKRGSRNFGDFVAGI